jgi:hypothetical protein
MNADSHSLNFLFRLDVDAAGGDNKITDHKIVYRAWISCLPCRRPEVLNDLR